ncbi:MAG: IclR family transcriptional regulator [Lautropia sp.]
MARPGRDHKSTLPNYTEALEIKTSDPDARFNNALARGLAILRCFQLDDELLGNVEIAERTGLPKATVSRLTFTLTTLGYLRYRSELARYELAAGVVGLAYPYLAKQTVAPVARPLMLALAADTRSNIGLGVQDGLSVLYLEYALGEAVMNRRQRVGFRVPLVRTAMGRACIAAMRTDERERIFESIRAYYPREWKSIRAEVEASLEAFHDTGYCLGVRTFDSATASVAVPFVHPDGRTVFSFNSSGDVSHQTDARLAKTGKRLIALVADVRSRLAESAGTGPSLGVAGGINAA